MKEQPAPFWYCCTQILLPYERSSMMEVEDSDVMKAGLHGKLLSDAALCKTPMTPKSLLKSCLALSVFSDTFYPDKPKYEDQSINHDSPSPSPAKRRKISPFSLFRGSQPGADVFPNLEQRESPTVRRILFGGKSLCFIYWEEGPEHFIYNEVVKVFFPSRARSSVNLRRVLLGTAHTQVQRTDYALARILKDSGVVDRRSCSNLKLIALTDLLRMKTGHKQQSRLLFHIVQVDSAVREVTERALGPLEKLRKMAETTTKNED
ncbi:hypothetical protein ACHWQZ_G007895 [Mnemiopsis leidyi]